MLLSQDMMEVVRYVLQMRVLHLGIQIKRRHSSINAKGDRVFSNVSKQEGCLELVRSLKGLDSLGRRRVSNSNLNRQSGLSL